VFRQKLTTVDPRVSQQIRQYYVNRFSQSIFRIALHPFRAYKLPLVTLSFQSRSTKRVQPSWTPASPPFMAPPSPLSDPKEAEVGRPFFSWCCFLSDTSVLFSPLGPSKTAFASFHNGLPVVRQFCTSIFFFFARHPPTSLFAQLPAPLIES